MLCTAFVYHGKSSTFQVMDTKLVQSGGTIDGIKNAQDGFVFATMVLKIIKPWFYQEESNIAESGTILTLAV